MSANSVVSGKIHIPVFIRTTGILSGPMKLTMQNRVILNAWVSIIAGKHDFDKTTGPMVLQAFIGGLFWRTISLPPPMGICVLAALRFQRVPDWLLIPGIISRFEATWKCKVHLTS